MKPIYEEIASELGTSCIKATYDNGVILLIPKDEANSDYQRYLRWLENPDAEESGTL
jgi:hypothetical protein